MSTTETLYQGKLRKALEGRRCHTEKLHGGIYSSGLPDLLVVLPATVTNRDGTHMPSLTGRILLVECKVMPSRDPPKTVAEAMGLLRGSVKRPSRQMAVGMILAKHQAPAFVAVLTRDHVMLVRMSRLALAPQGPLVDAVTYDDAYHELVNQVVANDVGLQ